MTVGGRRAAGVAVAALSAMLLSTCGDASSPAGPSSSSASVPSSARLDPFDVLLTQVAEIVQIGAVVFDQFGAPMAGVEKTWYSDDPGVATVDATGSVTAVGGGHTDIVMTVVDCCHVVASVVVELTDEPVLVQNFFEGLRQVVPE